jgi:hypothetical protein
MRMCTRCVLPETYRNISFDAAGVCNYCRTYDEVEQRLTDWETLGRLRDERIERVRGTQPYDALIGLSGGKDSSWIALQLSKRHGLKVLGFTFDNGFLTDYARNNIKLVADRLGIEHFFHDVDWQLHKQFYASAVRWFGTPCFGCSYSSYAFSYKLGFERGIPLVVHGRSRPQMFRELLAGSPDPFLPMVKLNINPYDRRANLEASLEAKRRMEGFLALAIRDRAMRERFYSEFFPPVEQILEAESIPEFIGYFLYQPYDEGAMMDELEAELGWKRPDDRDLLTHPDCEIHNAAAYIHKQVNRYPLLSFELSVMIREGQMTREAALERLAKEPGESFVPEETLEYMCRRLDVPRGDLPRIWARLRLRNRLRNEMLRLKRWVMKPELHLDPGSGEPTRPLDRLVAILERHYRGLLTRAKGGGTAA